MGEDDSGGRAYWGDWYGELRPLWSVCVLRRGGLRWPGSGLECCYGPGEVAACEYVGSGAGADAVGE